MQALSMGTPPVGCVLGLPTVCPLTGSDRILLARDSIARGPCQASWVLLAAVWCIGLVQLTAHPLQNNRGLCDNFKNTALKFTSFRSGKTCFFPN